MRTAQDHPLDEYRALEKVDQAGDHHSYRTARRFSVISKDKRARFLVRSGKIAERFQAFQSETEESKGEGNHAEN